MSLAYVAVERFEVELQLAEKLGLEFVDLEVDRHQALKRTVVEQRVQPEIPAADLQQVLLAHEAEISAEFEQDFFQLADKSQLQVCLGILTNVHYNG